MSSPTPRVRMFAGPNGSGKTTVKNDLGKSAEWFGIYINPDELEAGIRANGRLDLGCFGLSAGTEAMRTHFMESKLLRDRGLAAAAKAIECKADVIDFSGLVFNSYHASVLGDFLRRGALEARRSFSFETVMSSPDKVRFLQAAQARGFRTYLYYIATEDPAINIQRVKNRVAEGGHDVPEDKIVTRYHRSLELLPQAIRHAHRSYLFDTSYDEPWCFAQITDGRDIEWVSDEMPHWFQPAWETLHNPRDSA